MPGGFPGFGSELAYGQCVGFTSSDSFGGPVASGGAANTKGAYTTITGGTVDGGTPFDADWITVKAHPSTITTTRCSVDLAIGSSGSETILIPDLLLPKFSTFTNMPATPWPICVTIPTNIPAGSRLASRMQSVAGTESARLFVTLWKSAFQTQEGGPQIVDNYGFLSSVTQGSSIFQPGANTPGTYQILSTNVAHDLCGFFIMFQYDVGSTLGIQRLLLDVAVGATGSEQLILHNFPIWIGMDIWHVPYTPIPIPAGSQVQIRGASNSSILGTPCFMCFYGVRA